MVLPDGWAYGLVLETATALLLIWRRFWPLVTSTSAAGVMLLLPWAGPQLNEVLTPILFLALICYSLGRWIVNLRGLVGIGLLLLMFLADYLLVDARAHNFTDVVFVSTLLLPPYIFGRISRKPPPRWSGAPGSGAPSATRRCATRGTASRANCTTSSPTR